jgi:hypothetical protein
MLIQWHHGSGDFATAANWNPASVPASSDEAEIDAAGTYTVTSSANETVNILTTVATATLVIASGSTFTINEGTGAGINAGIIAIDNGSVLDTGGTLNNSGKIELNATNTTTGLMVEAATTLTGSGKVVMSDNDGNVILILSTTLTNVHNIISGAGQLAAIDGSFINDAAGVVDATGTANALILGTGSNEIVNAGVLEATGPGGLQIESSVDNAPAGIISATGAHAAVLIADGSTIIGGTLKTASGGAIDVGAGGGAVLDGAEPAAPVTNAGNLVVLDDDTLDLRGTIDNSGTITLDSTGDQTFLTVGGTGAALIGGGKIELTNNDEDVITGPSARLTNVNNTISGSGTLSDGLELANEAAGVIDANVPSSFNSFTILDTDVANAGLIEATAGGNLVIVSSPIANAPTGVIAAIGTNSVVTVAKGTITGGTLKTASGGAIEVGDDGVTFDGSTPASPIANAGNVMVTDNDTLTLLGTIDNSGTIKLDSTGDQTELIVGNEGAALSGGGKIELTNNDEDVITAASPSPTLTNVNNTVTGSGVLGDGLNLTNEAAGVIDANVPSSLTIRGNNVANAGLIEATAGGELEINSTQIDNASTGIIAATGTNSVVVVVEATITGGTLKTASGGAIEVGASGVTFDGSTPAAPITNAGNVVVQDGDILTVLGTIDNSGTITLDSTGDPTKLVIVAGGAALEGGGKIILTVASNEITGVAASDTLTNVDNSISGAGTLGGDEMTLVNDMKGVVDAVGGGNVNPLIVDTGANEIVNAGLMEATTGSLDVDSLVSNTGTIKSFGGFVNLESVDNSGALIAATSTILIDDGDSGTGSATIDDGGGIDFGAANTAITQNVTFANVGTGSTATLEFDAAATTNPTLIYDATISGFSTTKDRIDFTGLTFDGNATPTKELVNGNTLLTVTEGANSVSVTLAGNHMADHFTIAQDSGTGTLIIDPPASRAAVAGANLPSSPVNDIGASNIALLGNYIASMFASAVGSVSTPTTETQSLAMLAHPHA